jgi:glycosyltransferase involved in cell wall biosynthesis
MPAYNEEKLIRQSIERTAHALAGCDYELIVVDDGSTDNTYELATSLLDTYERLRVIRKRRNRGKGVALRTGFAHSSGQLVAFLDADLELPPEQIWVLWKTMGETGADAVIGSKLHPDSELAYPWYRRVISNVYYLMVRTLFELPLRDTQTGIKLFRREVLESVFHRIPSSRFAFDIGLLVGAYRCGYIIAEAPVTVNYSKGHSGAANLENISRMWWDTLRIYYHASFWKWLCPSTTTKLWIGMLLIGIMVLGGGLIYLVRNYFLLFVRLQKTVVLWGLELGLGEVLAWLLVIAGGGMSLACAFQLNKIILRAFLVTDNGGLDGILRKAKQEEDTSSRPIGAEQGS